MLAPRRPVRTGEWLVLAVVTTCFLAGYVGGWFDGFEVKTLDARFRARGHGPFEEKVSLLYITDECIQKLGGWPWPRGLHAEVVDLLTNAGAELIVFDIIFRDRLALSPEEDNIFVESCRRSGRVIFPTLVEQIKILDPDTLRLKTEYEVTFPFPELASSAIDFGFVNVEYQKLNADGIVRRLPLTMMAQGIQQPSLDLVVAAHGLQTSFHHDSERVQLGSVTIPLAEIPGKWRWDQETARALPHAFLANFLGEAMVANFPVAFYSDLVTGEADPAFFRNKIVLIGPSAIGLSDIKLTPFGEMPGVLIHANIIQNLMRQFFLRQPPIWVTCISLVVMAMASYALLVFLTPLWSALSLVLFIIVYNGLAWLLFSRYGVVLEMFAPNLLMIVTYVACRFIQMLHNLREAYNSLCERTIELEKSNTMLDLQVAELSSLNEAGRLFGQTLDAEILGNAVLNTFLSSLKASAGLIAALDEESEALEVVVSKGIDADNPGAYLYEPAVVQHVGQMFMSSSAVFHKEGRYFQHYIPLFLGQRRWGIVLLRQERPDAAMQQRVHFLATLGSLAATALENSRLYSLATVDGLTKLFVRRFFQIQLEHEFKRSRRYHHNMTLMISDIDHFKKFNDTYGHQQGDIVLREVAGVAKRTMRNIDVAARYGGEEFGLILPETDYQGAMIVAERIRQNVESLMVPSTDPMGDPLRVTLSIGVASYPTVAAASSDDLIRLADEALYEAKKAGRNRVIAAKPVTPDTPVVEPA